MTTIDQIITALPGRMQPGATAPDFTLSDASGQDFSLSSRRGRNVIVYFYPKAATPGCTTEACDFRDSLASLQGSGYDVIGISPDAPAALAEFTGDFGLNFPLLSDQDNAVALAYGAWGEKVINGEIVEGVLRSTVVIDADGAVVLARYQVDAQGHVAALRQELGL
ncbi:MAG TPA: peroxiredoxin [Arthrobacter sp.]